VFEGEHGDFALVMVGAMNVGSIELRLPAGRQFLNRPATNWPAGTSHALDDAVLARGAEFGRFNMGSTVIVLAAPRAWQLDADLAAGQVIRMGARIGAPI
jgi:phosphatidylserine decarboxylase